MAIEIKDIDIREDYTEEEAIEKYSTISSRCDINQDFKKWTTDLWMKVIQRAIEDAALAETLRNNNEELSEEIIENEESALGFLFDDTHKIPFDDYTVVIQCPRCSATWEDLISKASAESPICENCKYIISTKYVEYRIAEKKVPIEISLEELISQWGIENISRFRDGCKNRINKLSKKKPTKESKKVTDKKENIQEAKEFIKEISKLKDSPGNEDKHYSGELQPIDIAETRGYNIHQHAILKYIDRYPKKGGVLDLYKAAWWLKRLIELEERKVK